MFRSDKNRKTDESISKYNGIGISIQESAQGETGKLFKEENEVGALNAEFEERKKNGYGQFVYDENGKVKGVVMIDSECIHSSE